MSHSSHGKWSQHNKWLEDSKKLTISTQTFDFATLPSNFRWRYRVVPQGDLGLQIEISKFPLTNHANIKGTSSKRSSESKSDTKTKHKKKEEDQDQDQTSASDQDESHGEHKYYNLFTLNESNDQYCFFVKTKTVDGRVALKQFLFYWFM